METELNNLDVMAKELKETLTDFMLNHSAIEARKPYDEVWFIGPEGDRYYEDLTNEGRTMQTSLSKSYSDFYSILHPLLKDQPEDVLKKFAKTKDVITRTIEHRITWCETSKHALHLAMVALDDQLNSLKEICKDKTS
jgi:hypothetical protein